jgi:hypothetical protein
MSHKNEYIFEVNGSFNLLTNGSFANLKDAEATALEKAAIKVLTEMADQIEDDITREIKKVLPQEVIVQSHIRFHTSSVGLEAFIEIIDWMEKLAGTTDFTGMAVKVIRHTVEKAVKKSAKAKAIPINPNKFEIFVYPVNAPNELEGTNSLLRELIKSQNAQSRNQIEMLDTLPLLRRRQQESEARLQNSLRTTQGILIAVAALVLIFLYFSYNAYRDFSTALSEISPANSISSNESNETNSANEDPAGLSPMMRPGSTAASEESGSDAQEMSLLNKCLIGLLAILVILVGGIVSMGVYKRVRK